MLTKFCLIYFVKVGNRFASYVVSKVVYSFASHVMWAMYACTALPHRFLEKKLRKILKQMPAAHKMKMYASTLT